MAVARQRCPSTSGRQRRKPQSRSAFNITRTLKGREYPVYLSQFSLAGLGLLFVSLVFWMTDFQRGSVEYRESRLVHWKSRGKKSRPLLSRVGMPHHSTLFLRGRRSSTAINARLLPLTPSSNSKTAWKRDYTIKNANAHNPQDPKTVESLFMTYRITEDPMYREWVWKIFQAFQKHTILDDGEGYTSLHNVLTAPSPPRDNMESFKLAETLKYRYLLFSPAYFFPLNQIVFNTEAHIFPRLKQNKFQTGGKQKHGRK